MKTCVVTYFADALRSVPFWAVAMFDCLRRLSLEERQRFVTQFCGTSRKALLSVDQMKANREFAEWGTFVLNLMEKLEYIENLLKRGSDPLVATFEIGFLDAVIKHFQFQALLSGEEFREIHWKPTR